MSRTNNTKAIAEIIHRNIGGKLVEMEPEVKYPDDYQATVLQVAKENEVGYLPALKTKIDNIKQYDIVFLGFPTWGMQLPPPVKSFLNANKFSGKTLIPFNTHGVYGMGSIIDSIKKLCSNSEIAEPFSIPGGLERDRQYLVIKGKDPKMLKRK